MLRAREAALSGTMFPAALLAFSLTDQPMLVWCIIIGGMIILGPALLAWIKVFEFFKGKGFDASKFVTRAEFQAAKTEHDHQLACTVNDIKEDFAEIKKDITKIEEIWMEIFRDMPGLHRALGKLEGRGRPR